MADMVTDHMKRHRNIKFIFDAEPIGVFSEKGKYRVKWKTGAKATETSEVYDTILFAIGRDPCTTELNLAAVNVKINSTTKKIISGSKDKRNDMENTTAPNIYAIGDIIEGGIELTPVAVKAGKLLARRLFSNDRTQMSYDMVPTTVFTPLEYACVGLSEEIAKASIGETNIEVFHCFYKPLELVAMGLERDCYMKMICDLSHAGKVIGLHIIGLNAGETLQGFAAAIKVGITGQQLSSSVGIHPTSAEEVVKLHITKRSGVDPHLTGC